MLLVRKASSPDDAGGPGSAVLHNWAWIPRFGLHVDRRRSISDASEENLGKASFSFTEDNKNDEDLVQISPMAQATGRGLSLPGGPTTGLL